MLTWSISRSRITDIGKYLLSGGRTIDLSANSKWEAIGELAERAASRIQGLETETVVKAVKEREHIMGTGLKSGLAVPHARIENLSSPVVVFGRSRLGIDWDARDGQLSRFIFLILTPAMDQGIQVQILAAIARFMIHAPNAGRILSIDSGEEVIGLLRRGLKIPGRRGLDSLRRSNNKSKGANHEKKSGRTG
jgi:mannitol/fructose-specific phosphotransferase system IIA component (Ntr-type)